MMEELIKESKKTGLSMNVSKTKLMTYIQVECFLKRVRKLKL